MPVRVLCVVFAVFTGLIALGGCAQHRAGSGARATPDVAVSGADTTRGRAVYERECAACHGVKGTGGQIGPSLANERSRRNFESVRAIVLDPQPPMPKLYPARLTRADVRDVSAYVESL